MSGRPAVGLMRTVTWEPRASPSRRVAAPRARCALGPPSLTTNVAGQLSHARDACNVDRAVLFGLRRGTATVAARMDLIWLRGRRAAKKAAIISSPRTVLQSIDT